MTEAEKKEFMKKFTQNQKCEGSDFLCGICGYEGCGGCCCPCGGTCEVCVPYIDLGL